MPSKPSCSRTASALVLAASLQMTTPAAADDATPRLGVSPVRDVIQAMTLEEKVALVLGQAHGQGAQDARLRTPEDAPGARGQLPHVGNAAPASPAANRGWDEVVDRQMQEYGLLPVSP